MMIMYRFNVLCWLWNIYEGAELPSVYFKTNTKHCITYLALTQLFPVLVSHPEMYTLCSILLHFVEKSHFFFIHGCVHMGQMDFISSIFVRFIFQNYLGRISLNMLQMYILISPHCLCILSPISNSGDTQISVYIHVPFGHAVFQKAFWDKQCNF